ncbi:MAG: translation initiation factor IF-2 [Candidatus Hodarchaeales archaeon]
MTKKKKAKKKAKKSSKVKADQVSPAVDQEGLIRSPIFVILGHVDSGKTSLLDKVRGTAVQAREAGGITQHIGASFFPIETINAVCGDLLKTSKGKLEIPGVLFVDTPGHASFMNLRMRGTVAANLAILVIDIMRGIQPQTIESLRILKKNKVPFLVALNKIDRLKSWRSLPQLSLRQSMKRQSPAALQKVDEVIYDIMNELANFDFECERIDRVKNVAKQVMIVPTSAITGEGIPEVFFYLSGLAQRFLRKKLTLDPDAPAIGTVLEVKEEPGLGTTIDVILFDGVVKMGDEFLVSGLEGVISSKVKALLEPSELDEIRDPREKFMHVDQVVAAAGLKIVAPGIEGSVAGSSFHVVKFEEDRLRIEEEIHETLNSIKIETEKAGVLLKADALGSLEALVGYLKDMGVPIRIADVGQVTKREVIETIISKREQEHLGVILLFQTSILPDARELADKEEVPIFQNDIIYRLYEDYEKWLAEIKEKEKAKILEGLNRPAKVKILPYVFRQSNPAVVGVEIKGGRLQSKSYLINTKGIRIGQILQIQNAGETIKHATVNEQVAISIKGPTVGRQINTDDEFYVDLSESNCRALNEASEFLSGTELETLQEFIELKRITGNKFFAM